MKLFHPSRISPLTPFFQLSLALLGVLTFAVPATAPAQGLSFASAQGTIGSGLDTFGIAVDSSGNVFVADSPNGTVEEILAVNGSVPPNPTIKTLASGFAGPVGVAVDASGDVFVTETGTNNDAVKEIVAVNGSIPLNPTITVLASGFDSPFGVAVDAFGNVFVADTDHNAVAEILAVNGTIPANPTINILSSAFNRPEGVAVDAQGNVYVADSGNNAVTELLAVNGSVPSNPTLQNLGSGFTFPSGVAVDAGGNVYVVDTSTDKLKQILAVNGTIPSSPTINILGSGLAVGGGVAVDRRGNVFVTDAGNVVEVQTQSVNFSSVNVCPQNQTPIHTPCSNTLTLTYNIGAGTTIGSVKVLTLGAPNLDFQAPPGVSTCAPQTYPSATTCLVDVTFAPLYPGVRSGAVELLDGSGNVLAATNLYGTGIAPLIAFSPSSQLAYSGGAGFSFGQPSGVALDGSGNLFVTDFTKGAVYEMLAAGGFTTVNTLGGGFAFGGPAGVAVDGSGNAFVADFSNQAVYELPAAGGYATVNILGGGFNFARPTDVALDSAGDVFVSDFGGAIYEILAAGGYTTVVRLASSFTFGQPSGLAVDGSGNLFLSDAGNNAVYEILATGNYTTVNQLAPGLSPRVPLGVAVDASGNVFVADGGFSTVFELPVTTGYTTSLPLGGGFGSPQNIALDASGNVYVPDTGIPGTAPASIQVIQRSLPPALSFATTLVGGTSSDSPKSVQFENVGNQPLTGTGTLSDLLDFTVVAGPNVVPDCNGVLSLDPGAQCNISFSFTPQSVGPHDATLDLSDNSLNGNPSTQFVQLSGMAVLAPQISSISPASGAPSASVYLFGTNFGATQGNGSVTLNGVLCQVFYWSNTEIGVRVPGNAASGNLVVTANAQTSNGVAFTVLAQPRITGISQNPAPVGATITITGNNFGAYNRYWLVNFSGSVFAKPDPANWSDTSITLQVPTGAVSGFLNVYASGVNSNNVPFTVGPSIAITSLSPSAAAIGAQVEIFGVGFGATQGASTVTFNGLAATPTSWSANAIYVRVPAGTASGNVVVATPSGASLGVPFTVLAQPRITGISQNPAPVGATITITGTNFGAYNRYWLVNFSGSVFAKPDPANWSDTSITLQVPTGAVSGFLNVYASGVNSNNVPFTVGPSIAITSLSPSAAAIGAQVEIFGVGFGATQGASTVTFNGLAATPTSWSANAIYVRVPAGTTSGNVVVATPSGASLGVPFTVLAQPRITGISQNPAPVGATITITGTNFGAYNRYWLVNFSGSVFAKPDPANWSDTSITLQVPTGAVSGFLNVYASGVNSNNVPFTVGP